MFPVSDAFKSYLLNSHSLVHQASLYTRGVWQRDLPVESWSVTIDENAAVRRRCTLNLVDPLGELIPAAVNDPLWPKFNEIDLHCGVEYHDGVREMVPMGIYRISKPSLKDSTGQFSLSVDAYDRSRSVQRAKNRYPYAIPAGMNYADAIKLLVQLALPFMYDKAFNFMPTPYTTPLLVLKSGEDTWKIAQYMAASIGGELFFDRYGNALLRQVQNPWTSSVVMEYGAGNFKVTSVAKSLDDEQAYNYWVAYVEGSDIDPPIFAEIGDANPLSSTYYDASDPWAVKVPYFVQAGYIKTQQQADEAVAAAKISSAGVQETISFDGILNPAHEAGDLVRITRPRSKVDGLYTLSSITMNSSGTMTANTRTRTV